MGIEFKENEESFTNSELKKPVFRDGPLKELLVDYIGEKLNPENDEINVEMVVEVLAKEFPELVFVLAEENWIRGYKQGVDDMQQGINSIIEQENQSNEKKFVS